MMESLQVSAQIFKEKESLFIEIFFGKEITQVKHR